MNIKAPLNTLLGYGSVSLNIIKALYNLGEPLSLFPMGQPRLTTYDNELIQDLVNERFDKFNINDSSLTIFHEFALFDALQSKKEAIGFPFFEIDELDLPRIKSMGCVDKLFITSKWGEEVVKQSGVTTPIDIVPLGVDNSIFFPQPKKDGPYKFFTIGKIERRKCTDLLPALLDNAFNKDDDVELHVMCDSILPEIKEQMPYFRKAFANSPLGDKIFIHSIKQTDYDLAAFINEMDCGIFLTRAEGWGLPILQTMACNKPVITTDYSAHTEFCNNDNALLVNITEKEPAIDNIWFHGQGNWARIDELQIEQCVEHMRAAFNTKFTNSEGLETAKKFTWENTAKRIIECKST